MLHHLPIIVSFTSVDNANGSPEAPVQGQSLKVPSLLDIRWNKQYQQLIQVFQTKGPCDIPLSFVVKTEDGQIVKLGSWLGTQRRLYRKNELSAHKKEQLQVFLVLCPPDCLFDYFLLIFSCVHVQKLVAKGWISLGSTESKACSDDANWNVKYLQLLEYGKKHGDYNIPAKHAFVSGQISDSEAELSDNGEAGEDQPASTGEVASTRLGKWLERQRHAMRTHALRADRAEKLQKLVDAGLLIIDSHAEGELSWQRHFAALMEYAQTYQHCDVPYGYEVNVEISTSTELQTSSSHDLAEEAGENKNICKTQVLHLGHWLSNQRHAHNRTNRCLRADRAAQLQVGPLIYRVLLFVDASLLSLFLLAHMLRLVYRLWWIVGC